MIRPLPLGFQTQMGPALLESDLQLPAQHKPLNNPGRRYTGGGAQQGLGPELRQGVSDQDPPQGDRREAGMIPDGSSRCDFQGALGPVIPGDGDAGPRGCWVLETLLQSGQARSLEPGPSQLARQPWGRGIIEGSIQPQAGDEGDRLSHRLAKMQQLEGGIAAVSQEHQGAVRQPAAQLEDELAGPAGEFLGRLPLSPVIALRGGQGGQRWQSPDPLGPGDGSQPHQANPTQTAGFDVTVQS